MSPFLFTRAILAGQPLKVFNHGKHRRDFTYIDDIVEGVMRIADVIPRRNELWKVETGTPAKVFSQPDHPRTAAFLAKVL